MSTISVEYAHIYTNQHISEEHQTSINVLSEVKQTAHDEGKNLSFVVMVDDYSFPDPSFDYRVFSGWLEERGFKPDLLIRESQLIPVCDDVLSVLQNDKLKDQITDYVKAKKYPCSLFIASWYLLRLGKLFSPVFPAELVADELTNILPESFKPFEDKGLEIIAATPYVESVKAIHYRFLPGRLVA
ncbi:MAG TPA: hypothetical protein VNX65_01045 [Patescibacteria group bacterium]|jgi:hypothetical protein|nr:hypothetical protein [Patescibacteria group bacterium]